ncbi:MAG: glycosyl transferase family 1 [Planctomycetes bacterium RBG_13_63_9]|nr:MAG: glycosyl transferase family 1 [Planctomycetes bacterium RBG_13_63_9]
MHRPSPKAASGVTARSSRPLRLLFVSHTLPPRGRPTDNVGGMQRVAAELHEALARRPDVQLSSLLLRTSSRWMAARTVLFLTQALWTIRRMTRRGELDAVLFSSLVTGSLAPAMHRTLRACRVRALAIAHGNDVILPVKAYQHLLRRVFDALDAVLPVSRATAKACRQRGAAAAKVFVIPNGIDPKRFAPDPPPRGPRSALPALLGLPDTGALPEGTLLLCSTGRHVARKGFAWFVDQVMPLLPENVHYWLIGQGPETGKIRAAITRHRLQRRVRLLGRLDDQCVETFFRNADLHVMPNVSIPGSMEGFGVVALEAGLCGTPTIAARLEGIQDVIAEEKNGRLVKSGDARAFAEAVAYYSQNRPALKALAKQTISHTMQFSWDAVVDRHLRVIREVATV